MHKKPHVLITNDDGIDALGIKHLWQAFSQDFNVSIVAPSAEKSGAGLGITLRDPLHIQEVPWDKNTSAWKVSGTPADCVRMAMRVLLKSPPDLIVSGINRGSNAGRNVLYSGTVGGVIEGVLRNIPGIAFSCHDYNAPDYTLAQKHVLPIVRYLLANPLPHGTLLNVNVPTCEKILGVKLARQGRGYWIEDPDQRLHPEGRPYYWLGGKWEHHPEENHSDVALLGQGYITCVPIHVHELTDRNVFEAHQKSFEDSVNNS